MRKIALIWLSVLLLFSCSGEKKQLGRIASMAENDPESAFLQLDSLSRADLSERGQAEYDYLKAYTFYRSFFFLDDESMSALSSACLWFEAHGRGVDRMKAWELMGTAQTAAGNHNLGLVSLRKAQSVAMDIQRSRQRAEMTILLLVAVFATLVLYFRARRIQAEKQLLLEREEAEKTMSIAEDLQARLHIMEQTGSGAKMLDRLCEQYYVYEGTSNLQPKILREVRSIVEGLRSDPAEQKKLEDSLNARYNGVMRRLRAAFPSLKEEDYLLYLFTASGFSSTTVSTLLGRDKPQVYNRLYRLKERLKASDSPDAPDLLAVLER